MTSEVQDKLEAEKVEGERARGLSSLARQQRTSTELRGLVRALTREVDGLERLVAVKLNSEDYRPIKLPKPKLRTASPVTPVVLWSDWHIEEKVRLEQTAGRNEYNQAIARQRFERLIDNTAHLIKRESKHAAVGEAVVWLGGDFLSGAIHPDLVETAATSPIETAGIVHEMLLEGLQYIADQTKLERILVPTSYGNHGRITQGRPRISTGSKHNLEQWVYHLIARDLKDDSRFRFDVSETAFKYLELGDFRIRFHHGDAVRFGGGVGGISVPYYKAIARWDQETPAQLTAIGHWHQKRDFEQGVVNGSLIGTSEYSRLYGFEEPQQMILFIDRKRNRKAGVLPIFVD